MKVKKPKVKLPKGFKHNPELNKYSSVVLFPDKLARANEILKKTKLPKIS